MPACEKVKSGLYLRISWSVDCGDVFHIQVPSVNTPQKICA